MTALDEGLEFLHFPDQQMLVCVRDIVLVSPISERERTGRANPYGDEITHAQTRIDMRDGRAVFVRTSTDDVIDLIRAVVEGRS